MGPLAAVERFLERLFERQSARLFRTAIRPVQVQRRLERTMEEARTRDGGRTIVPHRFVVSLHPADLAALRESAPELASTLADGALAFARSHAYTLLDRPVVALRPDPRVQTGDIAVVAHDQPVDPIARPVDAVAPGAASEDDESARPAPDGPTGPETTDATPPTRRSVHDKTAVFVIPDIDGPHAVLREIRPDRSSRTITFDGRPLTIGRAKDNGLVLRDGRASRHHARIDGRRGSLVLTDLGSTNGSFVNDRRVEAIALGEGDRIRIGLTTVLIEAIEAAGGHAQVRANADAAGG